jgi:predicted TIM-barrel fold metal-dependent hydrolase
MKRTIIDGHAHLGLEKFIVKPISEEKRQRPAFKDKMDAPLDMLLARMDANGIARAVSFPHPLEEVDADAANRYVFDAYRTHPERIIPFALIGDDVECWLKQGARGFKQHEILQAPERFDLKRAYAAMAEAGVPLIIHARSRVPGMVAELVFRILSAAPSLKIIIAHLGRHTPNTSEHVESNLLALRDHVNVYFETSTVRDAAIFQRAVEVVGEDRVIFGTDFPFNSYLNDDPTAVEIALVERSHLDLRVKDKIFGENLLRCLGMEGKGGGLIT